MRGRACCGVIRCWPSATYSTGGDRFHRRPSKGRPQTPPRRAPVPGAPAETGQVCRGDQPGHATQTICQENYPWSTHFGNACRGAVFCAACWADRRSPVWHRGRPGRGERRAPSPQRRPPGPAAGGMERFAQKDYILLLDDMAAAGMNSLVICPKWMTTGYRSRLPYLDQTPDNPVIASDNALLRLAIDEARSRDIKVWLLAVVNMFDADRSGLTPCLTQT